MKTKFRTSAVDGKHVLSECGSGLGRVVKVLHRTQKTIDEMFRVHYEFARQRYK